MNLDNHAKRTLEYLDRILVRCNTCKAFIGGALVQHKDGCANRPCKYCDGYKQQISNDGWKIYHEYSCQK